VSFRDAVSFICFDQGLIGQDEPTGVITIKVSTLCVTGGIAGWFNIAHFGQTSGSVYIEAEWFPEGGSPPITQQQGVLELRIVDATMCKSSSGWTSFDGRNPVVKVSHIQAQKEEGGNSSSETGVALGRERAFWNQMITFYEINSFSD